MNRLYPLNHLLRNSAKSLLLHGRLPQPLRTIPQFSLYLPLPRSRSCESLSSLPWCFTPHDAISLSNLPRQCMACRLPIHGAFARAFTTAYHIQCFKCIVSTISISIWALRHIVEGLWGCRHFKILHHRWSRWKEAALVRKGLLPTNRPSLCEV